MWWLCVIIASQQIWQLPHRTLNLSKTNIQRFQKISTFDIFKCTGKMKDLEIVLKHN